MPGSRLKERPRAGRSTSKGGGLSRLNLLLLVLLAVIVLLLMAMAGVWAARQANSERSAAAETQDEGETPDTVVVGGQEVEIDRSIPQSEVEAEHFSHDEENGITYSGEALYGVDVSSHQGEIDWAAVAGDGIDFAILRIGYRGYTEGAISEDGMFERNYEQASEQGLKLGVYFFSQAISEAEAVEEARQVLSWLEGKALDGPVVYDWESIENNAARTDDTDGETVTACAKAFCDTIRQAGYTPMLYCNGMLGYLSYDLSELSDVAIWYAEYGEYPSYAYAFEIWQYTESGTVAGIDGSADRDIWFQD